jgi:hypothetical protein
MKTLEAGALVFWLCLSLAGVFPQSPASRFALIPVFGPDSGGFIGLSLVNTAASNNDLIVTWMDADGNIARIANLSLGPGAQHLALVRDILAIPEDPAQGWIRIDFSEPGLLCYMSSGRNGILDGAESASQVSTGIMLPHVAVHTGFVELEYADTLVNLINPGAAPAHANAALTGLDGKVAGEIAISIPARSSLTFRVSDSFRDALPRNSAGGRIFSGYLKISSDQGLAAWLQIDTPLSRRLLRGLAAEEISPARLVMGSHFAAGGTALYRSDLNLINAGQSEVTLECVAQLDRGGRFTARRTLSPGQGFREDVLALFKIPAVTLFPPPMLTGFIRITAIDGVETRMVGDVDLSQDRCASAMLVPVGAPASTDATLPLAISDAEYFTGYAIANPNELLTMQTDVTIELLDRNGRMIGTPRKVSLSPSARFVSLIQERIQGGYLRIRSNGPVALVGSIGTTDGSTLSPLPALR